MKVIIIGGGETGFSLANILGEQHTVSIIEKEAERAQSIATKTGVLVIQGDGSDLGTLKEAGIEQTEALIITTADDKTSMLIGEIARKEKVQRIISLVNEPQNEAVFHEAGIFLTVPTVMTKVNAIHRRLYHYGDAVIIAQFSNSISVIKQTIGETSPLIGQMGMKKAVLTAIFRKEKVMLPEEDGPLEAGDVLLYAIKTEQLVEVVDIVSGK